MYPCGISLDLHLVLKCVVDSWDTLPFTAVSIMCSYCLRHFHLKVNAKCQFVCDSLAKKTKLFQERLVSLNISAPVHFVARHQVTSGHISLDTTKDMWLNASQTTSASGLSDRITMCLVGRLHVLSDRLICILKPTVNMVRAKSHSHL